MREHKFGLMKTTAAEDLTLITTNDCPLINEDSYRRVEEECVQLEADGWTRAPNWLPVPLAGYEWQIPGQIWVYMKPKPKIRHILRYKYIPEWWSKWRAERWIKKNILELAKKKINKRLYNESKT